MQLSELMDKLVEDTKGEEHVTLGELLAALDTRSYGPLLLVPALLAVIPLVGAIPGVSILTGSLVIILAFQAILGRSNPWLPDRLLKFEFSREKLARGTKKARPWVLKSESVVHSRLTFLTDSPYFQLIAAFCLGMGFLFIPMALVPMAVLVPGLAVAFFALGLMARDGYLIITGFLLSGIAFASLFLLL